MKIKKEPKSNVFKLLWYSHPRVAIGFILLGVNLAVIILFTILLCLTSGNGFFDELAYLFTYTMCSDGIYDFVNSEEDLACFIIKIVLTIVQMIIFSGALIGFTTDILQSAIDNRLQNTGKLKLRNHYVFLNWSGIGPNIIYDLSFLEGKKVIVILCNGEKDEVLNSIQNIFTENKRKMRGIRIFIKKGDPSSMKHLTDISIGEASHIAILLPHIEAENHEKITANDLSVFKLLINVLSLNKKANIVAEVEENRTVESIEKFISLSKENCDRVFPVSHNSLIGHILAKIVINPTYSILYHDLLSYDGCELYAIPSMDVEEALYKYNDCIPLINYDDDCLEDQDGNKSFDTLYILSDDEKSLGIRSESKTFIKSLEYKENYDSNDFTVIVISNSNRKDYLKDEFDSYSKTTNTKIDCRINSFQDSIEDIVKNTNELKGNIKFLLLSSENEPEAMQDAHVFVSMLSLRLNQALDKNISVFVEIINPKNLLPLNKLGVASAIVTNKLISLYIVQLITHPNSKRFFQDIIMTNNAANLGSIDFKINKAKELLVFNEEHITFSCYSEIVQSFYVASAKTKMLVGIKKPNIDSIMYLCDKMDEKHEIILEPEDELIYVDYHEVKEQTERTQDERVVSNKDVTN